MSTVREAALAAKTASRVLRVASTQAKNRVLVSISSALSKRASEILAANAQDLAAAKAKDLSAPMIDRLMLNEVRLTSLARAVDEIRELPDPVGRINGLARRPSGILVGQMQVPIGVVGMVYESRPNVTIDAAALCLKAGNAVVLRGGSEAQHTNMVLAGVVKSALEAAELPPDAVAVIAPTSRETIRELLGLAGILDVVIPRGGKGLISFVQEHARVPVIAHYEGVCHLFVDRGADIDRAIGLIIDGKAKRPGVCNALECVLVHDQIAELLLPRLASAMAERGVEVRADERARAIVQEGFLPAAPEDFGQEFLAKILALKVVNDLDEALDHIAKYGSLHTESIMTPDYSHAQRFLREVDASCVLVNASTRFNDGGELGLGAELGIATSKLHAYGPMGLDSLTTKKWIVYGEGEVRG